MGLFGRRLSFGGVVIGRNLAFQNGVELNSLRQLEIANHANPNSPGAYIREGLLLDGYLRLRFGGLIFGKQILKHTVKFQ